MRVPLQWSGGVNLNAEPHAIRDDQVAFAKNAFPSLEGLLSSREPVLCARVAVDGSGAASPPTWWRPVTLAEPDPVTGFDFVLHYQDDVNNGEYLLASTFNRENGVTPTGPSVKVRTNAAGQEPFGPYVFVNYRGRVLAIGGDNEGFYQLVNTGASWGWVKATFSWPSGTPGTEEGQNQAIAVKPKAACSYRGRMVYANFGVGKGNWLVFADSDSVAHTNNTNAPLWARIGPDVLSDNGRHLELRGIQGENITAILEVSLMGTGSQIETGLLVLTDRSALLCTGEPAQTTDAVFDDPIGYIASFRAQKYNYEVGCVGQSCITTSPYGAVWASREDVWLMQGNMPVRIGTNIRPALRECPPTWRQYWAAAYANGVVFLSLVTQATSDVYHLATQHWRLDLRTSVPQDAAGARWWGPQDYTNLYKWSEEPGLNPAGTLAHSLVVKRDADESDVVYGIIRSLSTTLAGDRLSLNLISFNQGEGGMDIPFEAAFTGRQWQPDEAVAVGDIVLPSTRARNGRIYICTVAGTTGPLPEPIWDTSGGATIDGSVTFYEVNTFNGGRRVVCTSGNFDVYSIKTDVRFKELDFGDPARVKVIRRADLTAFLSEKTYVRCPVVANGGDGFQMLGPVAIGGDPLFLGASTADHLHALNTLGLLVLDDDHMAQEFMARALRPRPVTGGDPGWMVTGVGTVKGRQLQPMLQNTDGYVIDETNDRLIWTSAATLYQATLTQGIYETLTDLMTHIVTQMNSVQGTSLTGFTISSNPWSFTNVTSVSTYTTRIRLTFSARAGALIAFVMADEDASGFYGLRSKRLLALLGYDTSGAYSAETGATVTLPGSVTGKLIPERDQPSVLTSPTEIRGVQVIPVRRAAAMSVHSLELDVFVKPGLPLGTHSR